jgi:hypothetical protein
MARCSDSSLKASIHPLDARKASGSVPVAIAGLTAESTACQSDGDAIRGERVP